MRKWSVPVVHAFIIWLCAFLIHPAAGSAKDCATTDDWKDIYVVPANTDPDKNIRITLELDKTVVKPGETVSITFTADKDCYLTLMDVGTSKTVVRLWPNDYSGTDNFIQAGEKRQFPRPSDKFGFFVEGPVGVENVVAYATSEKDKILSEDEFRDFKSTGFKTFKGGLTDLDRLFRKGTDPEKTDFSWGTAQVNLCIEGADSTTGGADSGEDASSGSTSLETSDAGSKGRTYVLSVGAPTEGLKYCDSDATAFASAMAIRLGLKPSNVKLIVGSRADYDGFKKGLQWMAEKTRPEDAAVIYFSGHGSFIPDRAPLDESDNQDECFVLYHKGTIKDYASAVRDRVVMLDDEFNGLLKRIPARKKVVVADACHSATLSKKPQGDQETALQGSQRLVSKYYPLRHPESGEDISASRLNAKAVPTDYGMDHEAILSACLDNESSYEDAVRKSGLFTYHLLNAIKGGASSLRTAFDRARQVTLDETKGWSSDFSTSVQTPSLTDPHGITDGFLLGH